MAFIFWQILLAGAGCVTEWDDWSAICYTWNWEVPW